MADKRALIIGIDAYISVSPLQGCVADATAMSEILRSHEDGSPNFDVRLLVGSDVASPVTAEDLRHALEELFDSFTGDTLFYFSGHGALTSAGGVLATQEATDSNLGVAMDELLDRANKSSARSVLLILDCCMSGSLGNPAGMQPDNGLANIALLREGITILAASKPAQAAIEIAGHGVFTELLLGALNGGAADVRGLVSAASMYGYAEAALGAWSQRPMYKSHANRLAPVRRCRPAVTDELLRKLPKLFPNPEHKFPIDLSFEHTEAAAKPENVAIFDQFKTLRNAGLLRTFSGDDLYFCALRSGSVYLTPLGQFYWRLAEAQRI